VSNQTGLSAVAENIIALHLAALRSENHRLMTILKLRDRRTDLRMRALKFSMAVSSSMPISRVRNVSSGTFQVRDLRQLHRRIPS
jgi:hypothetical protein